MALIALPVMMRYGYDMRLATGVIAASGTITQLIPPSLVLVVLADQLGRSVGDMYRGAIGPQHRAGGAVLHLCLHRQHCAARRCRRCRPRRARCAAGRSPGKRLRGMVPSLALIFMVLGTILLGLATPTEAGAMGVVGALLLAVVNRPARASAPSSMQVDGDHHAHHRHGGVHPLGSTHLRLRLPGRRRQAVDRGAAPVAAGRPGRLPHLRQYLRIHPRLLPRFLRDRLHHHSAAGAGCGEARHRPDLVRRPARGQHADLLHASAIRLRAVLFARHRARAR